jgi:hypothetical protein
MPKLVCIPCEVELKPSENGVYVVEMASFGPYKIWNADVWICPKCKHEVVAGFGYDALAEHYQDKFVKLLEKIKASKSRIIYDYEYHPLR